MSEPEVKKKRKRKRKLKMLHNAADVKQLAYVGRPPASRVRDRDSDSWFTPTPYIEAAHAVLRGIDLDPFSSKAANAIVKAKRFLTKEEDALTCSWKSRNVWMNPPYGRLCLSATEKFLDEFHRGSFRQGIVLVNNATETRFFQQLLAHGSEVCFTDHRIAFWNSDGKKMSGNTRGQAFFHFTHTPDVQRFRDTFNNFGTVISCL
jgi:predicted RNA methylase